MHWHSAMSDSGFESSQIEPVDPQTGNQYSLDTGGRIHQLA